jgi:ABC-2 type transport system ATP-binding protein
MSTNNSNIAIEIVNVNKSYSNEKIALTNVNLIIPKGSFFALLGANGAGKSTLIGLITGVVRQQDGIVKILSHDISKKPRLSRMRLGVVPQELNMNPFEKVRQIIINQAGFYGLMPKAVNNRADDLLKQLDLWEKRDTQVIKLSGGMKRRLMIARALIHNPEVLILDEPTAGLDVAIRRQMWEYLQKLNNEGLTILLTTHYLEEAEKLCNNVALIRSGKIIRQDLMSDFMKELDRQVVALTIDNSSDCSINKSSNKSINYISKIPLKNIKLLDNNKIQVEISKDQHLSDVISVLNKHNLKVTNIEQKISQLEYYFLHDIEGVSINES